MLGKEDFVSFETATKLYEKGYRGGIVTAVTKDKRESPRALVVGVCQ